MGIERQFYKKILLKQISIQTICLRMKDFCPFKRTANKRKFQTITKNLFYNTNQNFTLSSWLSLLDVFCL